MNPPHHQIGGTYLRLADPGWVDPLDATFAASSGGRWNPAPGAPGTPSGGILTLYLNADMQTARANARARLKGLPYGPEDLDPATAPVLVDVSVPDGQGWDLRFDEGLAAVALAETYPVAADGTPIGWARCQPIGLDAWRNGADGIACRSAAEGGNEELAWFGRNKGPVSSTPRSFDVWYWA